MVDFWSLKVGEQISGVVSHPLCGALLRARMWPLTAVCARAGRACLAGDPRQMSRPVVRACPPRPGPELALSSQLRFADSTSRALSSQPQIPSFILVKAPSGGFSHLSPADFSSYKQYLHSLHIYSSSIPKPKAAVSTEHHVSISYKLNTLQFSLFPLLLFHPVFLWGGFCPPDSFSP